MGKAEFVCPNCNENKISIHFKNEIVKKVKGGEQKPILTQMSENHWTKNPAHGIGVQCKCGEHTFVGNIFAENQEVTLSESVSDNQVYAVFCNNCVKAFLVKTVFCPECQSKL